MMPTREIMIRSCTSPIGSSVAARIVSSESGRAAKARTRRPFSDSCWLASSSSWRTCSIGTVSPCHSACEQRSMTTSGAPLTVMKCGSVSSGRSMWAGRSWNVAMNLYSESNGTSAMRGNARRVSSASTPIFAASTTSAASVGSPMIDSSAATVASLHNARPSARPLKSGVGSPAGPRMAPDVA